MKVNWQCLRKIYHMIKKKKLILCLRCNVSLVFSKLSTLERVFGKHPSSEYDHAGLLVEMESQIRERDEF